MKVAHTGWLAPGEAVDRILALRADREARALVAAQKVRDDDIEREERLIARVPLQHRVVLDRMLAAFASEPTPEPEPELIAVPEPAPQPKRTRKRP